MGAYSAHTRGLSSTVSVIVMENLNGSSNKRNRKPPPLGCVYQLRNYQYQNVNFTKLVLKCLVSKYQLNKMSLANINVIMENLLSPKSHKVSPIKYKSVNCLLRLLSKFWQVFEFRCSFLKTIGEGSLFPAAERESPHIRRYREPHLSRLTPSQLIWSAR